MQECRTDPESAVVDRPLRDRRGGAAGPGDRLVSRDMRRVLTSVLSVSKGEAARRVRAAEAVGPRTSMLGEPLEPVRPVLAAAQQAGEVSAEKVDDHRTRPGQGRSARLRPGRHRHRRGAAHRTRRVVPARRSETARRPVRRRDRPRRHPAQRAVERRIGATFISDRPATGPMSGTSGSPAAAGAKLKALLDPLAKPRVDPCGESGSAARYGQRSTTPWRTCATGSCGPAMCPMPGVFRPR